MPHPIHLRVLGYLRRLTSRHSLLQCVRLCAMLGITSKDSPHWKHISFTLSPRLDFGRLFVRTVADTILEHLFNIYADYTHDMGHFTAEVYAVPE